MSNEKEEVSTAVKTSAPDAQRSGKLAVEPAKTNGWTVYKPGEGHATRLGLMVVVFTYVIFAARQWYYNWVFIPKFFRSIGIDLFWITDSHKTAVQFGGMLLVAGTMALLGYYYIYIRRDSADFLIKTDTELGKVTWPKVSPWFKSETQVWGATYVVMIVITFLTVYVLAVDTILETAAKIVFFSK